MAGVTKIVSVFSQQIFTAHRGLATLFIDVQAEMLSKSVHTVVSLMLNVEPVDDDDGLRQYFCVWILFSNHKGHIIGTEK